MLFSFLQQLKQKKFLLLFYQDVKGLCLKRVDLNLISNHLIKIAKKEGYSLDEEGAKIISNVLRGQ